jgi:hypothetical protein
MTSEFAQFGALGICVLGMAGYIMYLHKAHIKERKEKDEVIKKQFDRMHEMADKTNEITKENTSVLASLKTLLEMDIKMQKK